MSETLLEAIIGFLSAVVGGVIVLIAGRQKNKADATKSISEAATAIAKTAVDDLLEPLTKRVDDLEKQIAEQKGIIGRLKKLIDAYARRVIYLMGGIETLIKQIQAKNEIPCWTPDEWNPEKGEDEYPG